MSDKKLFTKPNIFSGLDTFDYVERGYTLKRKLAIGAWVLVLTALVFITSVDFSLFNAGIEWFIDINVALMPNFKFNHQTLLHTYIPLIDWLRYPLFALSVIVGIKSLIVIFIPPPTRVVPIRIHAIRSQQHEATK